jgi:DNA mismatch endonuclease (patch repair protein)
MQSNRAKDTTLELRFRRALWAAGLRGYRKNWKKLPGKPDVVFVRHKLAIFVHGCFWHGCRRCNRTQTKTNTQFWTEKIAENIRRDAKNEEAIASLGYTCLVFWECDLKRDTAEAIQQVSSSLSAQRHRSANTLSIRWPFEPSTWDTGQNGGRAGQA